MLVFFHFSFADAKQLSIFFKLRVRLEKEMATHSTTLVWKIPWLKEPGRLQFMGSQRVRHDWATSLTHSRVRQVFRLAGMAFTENGRKARSCPPGVLSVFFASHTFHVIEMSSIFLNYFSWVFALKEWGRCSSNRPKAASVTRNYFLLRWILPGHNDLPYFCWFYSWFIRDRTSLTLVSTELPCRSVLMKYNVWTDLLFNI